MLFKVVSTVLLVCLLFSTNVPVVKSTSDDIGYAISCDFELDFCGYVSDDAFNWTRHSGHTASTGTGPSVDHTTGNTTGHYIYIETSSPRVKGDIAVLKSRWFDNIASTKGQSCNMSFYTHMLGATIGELNVYIEGTNGYKDRKIQLNGSNTASTDSWILQTIPLDMTGGFRIIFEGITGDSHTGDIAIDDIHLEGCDSVESYCTADQFVCNYTHTHTWMCMPDHLVCNFYDNCDDKLDEVHCGGCDFEDFCGWKQDPTDQIDWIKHSGSTSSSYTGPSYDHTKGDSTGHYMYIEATSKKLGDVARLTSPEYSASGSNCQMIFWYHMRGTDIGSLMVLLNNVTVLTNLTGPQSNNWIQATVKIGMQKQFFLVLEATVGKTYLGDIAVDDIDLINCGCDYKSGECSCPNGYTGDNCENKVKDKCSNIICQNNGTCNSTTGKCNCPNSYRGDSCENKDLCWNIICQNNGTCDNTTGKCNCASSYRGDRCEIKCDKKCRKSMVCYWRDSDTMGCRCPGLSYGGGCTRNVDCSLTERRVCGRMKRNKPDNFIKKCKRNWGKKKCPTSCGYCRAYEVVGNNT